jgi:hypothetical protein
MTDANATPCFSLFSDENKFSLMNLNGGNPPLVTAFTLEPVTAVAVVEESEYDSDESEESDSDSDNTIDEMLAIRQIVTRVERDPLEPEEEKEADYESDGEVFVLRRNEDVDEDADGEADDEDSDDEEEEESNDEDNDQAEVDAALSSIAEYEDDKFKELVENIKKTKLFKNAKLIDDAEVRVDLGWTSMILYIR